MTSLKYKQNLINILYLENDLRKIELFRNNFTGKYTLYFAQNTEETLSIITNTKIHIVIFNINLSEGYIYPISKIQELNPEIIFITQTDTDSTSPDKTAGIKTFCTINTQIKTCELSLIIDSAYELYKIRYEKAKLENVVEKLKYQALESDRLKTAFLSNLSHEIRTPLNGILGFSSLVKNFTPDNHRSFDQYSSIIEESCDKLLDVIDNIITMSKLQVGNVKRYNIDFDLLIFIKCIIAKYMPIAKEKNIDLQTDSLENIKELIINTDKTKLHEIINQLLNNAIKFTPFGKIKIGLLTDPEKNIIFYVRDTGIGIQKERHKDIFRTFSQETEIDSFTQNYYGGNGLGLSIAKGLVEILNGEIWVESEKGKGAIFLFTFPLNIIKLSYQHSIKTPQNSLN